MRNFLLALMLFATSALAADFTGNWSGEGVTNGESHSLYFVLKQEGNKATGTGGPDASEQHEFNIVKVDGDNIVLEISLGEKGTLHFELKAEGDRLKGTVLMVHPGGRESGEATLKKVTT